MKNLIFQRTLLASTLLGLTACGGGGGGNTAPEFSQSSYNLSLEEDTVLVASVSATDQDNDIIAFTVSKSPTHGALSVNRDGSFSYTPATDFHGEDSAAISVSDSIASTTAKLIFTVTNVNDLPVVATSSVAVASDGKTTGQVNASDADGDRLAYAIVSQPENGQVSIDADSGAFIYTAASLTGVAGEFVVSVSDGIAAAVEATVSLTPSYASNKDKLSYYYSSAHSHLVKAEALITVDSDDDRLAITDSEVSDSGYMNLAVGYAKAGFGEKAQTIIQQNILVRTTKAQAYLDASIQLDALGQSTLAGNFRATAITQYNTYIAEIGIANITSADASFFMKVVRAYLAAGDSESATNLLSTFLLYADTLKDQTQEETIAHRRFVTAAQETLEVLVADYLANQSVAAFDNAVIALNAMTKLTDSVSFNETGSAGSAIRYENYRGNWYGLIARNAFLLSLNGSDAQKAKAVDIAKTNLAKLMALYTDTQYDKEYSFAVSALAATTLSRYPSGLANVAGVFNALYPDYVAANATDTSTGNLALDMVIAEEGMKDADTKNAYRDHYAYQILNDAVNGQSIDATIDTLKRTFSTTIDDERYIVEALIEQDAAGDNDKRAAWLLAYAGYQSASLSVLKTAMEVLQSEPYLDDVGLSLTETLGSQGCMRLAELTRTLAKDADSAQTMLSSCANMVSTHYNSDSTLAKNKLQAHAYAALMYNQLGNNSAVDAALSVAASAADTFAEFDEQTEYKLYIASTMATLGHLASSQSIWHELQTLTLEYVTQQVGIKEQVDAITLGLKQLDDVLNAGNVVSYPTIYNLQEGMLRQAGINSEFAATRASFKHTTSAYLDDLLSASATFAENEKTSLYQDFIKRYAQLGEFSKASSLALNEIYTEADRAKLLATVVVFQATQDAFPATDFANVDTDQDGLPNFFLLSASDAAISASGLSLDTDADNDGVIDPEDLLPLDAQ